MIEALYGLYTIVVMGFLSLFFIGPYFGVVIIFYCSSYGVAMFFNFAAFVYKMCLFFLLLPITYQGLENIPKESCIVIANHESSLDIFLVGRILGVRHHTWLAKEELWQYPVLASMLNCFAVPVSFAEKSEAMKKQVSVVAQAKKRLDAGSTVILFPEGGRFVDGSIHPFRSGFAVLAYLTGKPVVPIFIQGAGKVLPPGKNFIQTRSSLKVIVGQPFICGKEESIDDFKQRVFCWYCEMNALHAVDHGIRVQDEARLSTVR